MYGPKVVRRLRPAASVGEFTQPSVTKTASGGVLAATHSAASRSADESTWLVEVAVQAATSSGDGMLRARAAASAGAGQRRQSARQQGGDRQREWDAEVRDVEEEDAEDPILARRRRPAGDESERTRPGGLEDGLNDERHGEQQRAEQQRGIARRVAVEQPPAGENPRQREQREDRQEEEVERGEQPSEHPGRHDQRRPIPPASGALPGGREPGD